MIKKLSQQFALTGQLQFIEQASGFPMIQINNKFATATISLYGGQILEFQPHSQSEPVLWLSEQAIYHQGKAIRGGIPICWPWFGDYIGQEKQPAHGFARLSLWDVCATKTLSNGSTEVILQLPCLQYCQNYQASNVTFKLDLRLKIIVGEVLKIELLTINKGDHTISLSNALHAYFNVSDVHHIQISGLDDTSYIDKLDNASIGLQQGNVRLTTEMDRVYQNTKKALVLHDRDFKRRIIIAKAQSFSTIVWNPWQESAKKMVDMANNGWQSMICIEPANVHDNTIMLGVGQKQTLTMLVSIEQD